MKRPSGEAGRTSPQAEGKQRGAAQVHGIAEIASKESAGKLIVKTVMQQAESHHQRDSPQGEQQQE